jgi:hypothetical protein
VRFDIEILELFWIDGPEDDPGDQCCHGKVRVAIGDECFESSATLSATGLFLLRTLTEDHVLVGDSSNGGQMLPCCGHFMLAEPDKQSVMICGCSLGIDWSVVHEGDEVVLGTTSGATARVPQGEYRDVVERFAEHIEELYRSCLPKDRKEEPEQSGYEAFWNEWRRRRASAP